MLTTYTLQRYPVLPDFVVKDGQTYVRREITARNVRVGDLMAFVDMTGPAGTVGTFAIGVVTDTYSTPAGRGRSFVAPWRRRTITVRGYRGSLKSFQMPPAAGDWAHDDRATVWRLTSRAPIGMTWDYGKLARCARYIGNGEYLEDVAS